MSISLAERRAARAQKSAPYARRGREEVEEEETTQEEDTSGNVMFAASELVQSKQRPEKSSDSVLDAVMSDDEL